MKTCLLTFLICFTIAEAEEFKPTLPIGIESREIAERVGVKPWKAKMWLAYYGTFVTGAFNPGGYHELHITPYNDGRSAFLSIVHSHSKRFLKRPVHTIHEEVKVNLQTGELTSKTLKDAQMVRYTNPKTRVQYFGIRVGETYMFNKEMTKFPDSKEKD